MEQHLIDAIRAHAAAEYPAECCGLVVQIDGRPQYIPCRNISGEPGDRFELAPEDYAAAEDLGEIVGIVHSHPDATSRASPADAALCNAGEVPWHIVSWPEGDLNTLRPAPAPLLSREFVHGVQDCWQVCADWYGREWGLEFERFDRADRWWEDTQGESLYEARYGAAGFYRVDAPQRGDMLVMRIGRTAHPNHAGIYLGDNPSLPGEAAQVFGPGPFLLHHLYGRRSEIIVFGGQWLERTALILRHREARKAS
ncbi:C40 family peptidase [Azotobacter beijerinckii]|uniref:Proteasome lid subunit RPN8/RPN11, contains Jab1/MPN metalloenzyme (JAMM) motif n=1 Tax=Azotobacter beijerinckii TaxID=170623 RepID=A0A1I0Z129_9GAMM|nr:C40 family peptidase [Azotobacter beijerinckii]SFB18816.1 Proteasome lid subunit RPN8/RPN11, contains Jab1/MPN metalloenzyme (JAMM) motif [Azotobacter beijerinckii]